MSEVIALRLLALGAVRMIRSAATANLWRCAEIMIASRASRPARSSIWSLALNSPRLLGAERTLRLDDSVTNPFNAGISGFTAKDPLDLSDISFGGTTTASYSSGVDDGNLTIADTVVEHTLTFYMNMIGNYTSASGFTFNVKSDGHGGTAVT